ncbi:MAG: DinB family protein [Chloroflexota bacterium]
MSKRAILLDALASMPKDLVFMLRRADEAAIHRRPAEDQWAIADVLRHLTALEPLYLARLQKIVVEERPYLPYLHPETEPDPTPTPLADLLAAVSQARQETLTYLHSLKPGDWQRTAVHQTLGDTKLRYMVQLLVDHDTEHLNQLAQIQQALK